MRSIIIFAVIQLLSFLLGTSDAVAIAIAVFTASTLIFLAVYISASLKDRLQKKRFTKTLFES